MSEYKKKIRRQIEIIGLALTSKEKFSLADLSDRFNVEELTIKRDLQEIRTNSINIHSTKKDGIKIFNPIDKNKLKELILSYISFSYSENYFDKATSLLIKKHKEQALSLIIQIQQAIESKIALLIDYQSTAELLKTGVLIHPLRIFQLGNDWRLLALNSGEIKQYVIVKIKNIRLTNNKFEPVSEEIITSRLKFSLISWLSKDQIKVKIKFDKDLAGIIKEREYIESQSIINQPDGSIIFEAVVNSLTETAAWIIAFGKGVKVLEPKELKKELIRLATEAIQNYKK